MSSSLLAQQQQRLVLGLGPVLPSCNPVLPADPSTFNSLNLDAPTSGQASSSSSDPVYAASTLGARGPPVVPSPGGVLL